MTRSKIAIIGTGNVGGALGCTLARAGHEVCFGVREGKDIGELLDRAGANASSATPAAAAARADLVFLAVPGNSAVEAARDLGDLSGKVLVDCTNPLTWTEGPVWNPPREGSMAAALAAALPGVRVVKAFNTFGAESHADPSIAGHKVDVYLAGDDADARRAVADVARSAGYEPIDSGPLRNAAVLENVAMLWIHLAMVGGQGRSVAFKLLHRG